MHCRNGVLSVQALGEYFSIVTRRIRSPLSTEEAVAAIDRIGMIPTLDIDPAMVRRAIVTHSH